MNTSDQQGYECGGGYREMDYGDLMNIDETLDEELTKFFTNLDNELSRESFILDAISNTS